MTEIKSEVAVQRDFCSKTFLSQKDYYKGNFKAIVWLILFGMVIFGGVVAWSYGPMQDIATLKSEMNVLIKKFDTVIDMSKENNISK